MDFGVERPLGLAQDFILSAQADLSDLEFLPSKALGLMRVSAKEVDTRERALFRAAPLSAAPPKALLSCFLS
jgi:hypothetical protein